MSESTVARPKNRPKPETKPAGPKTLGVRCSPEWSDWVEMLARRYRTTVAGLIDRALTEWAESEGVPEKPPERTP